MRADKGDFISIEGFEADVDTTEVLAVHRAGAEIYLNPFGEEGLEAIFPQEFYVVEQPRGNFDLISEHEVTRVYRG